MLRVAATMLLLLLASHPAPAAEPQAVALFPILVTDGARDDIAHAADEALGAALVRGGQRALFLDGLSQRLKRPLRLSVEDCRSEARCLTRLVRELGVSSVVYGQASQFGARMRITLHRASVESGRIERTTTLELSDTAGLERALERPYAALFDAPFPKAASADLELLPLEELHEPTLLPLAPLNPAKSDVALTPPKTQGPPEVSVATSREGPPYRLIAAAGLGTLGAVLAFVGHHHASEADEAYEKANARSGDGRYLATMAEAAALQDEGDARTSRANTYLLLGLTSLVAGGALAVLDLMVLR